MNKRNWLISSLSALVVLTGCATSAPEKTVMDTISNTPNLTTAAKLIRASGLDASLEKSGPFTVFAPSDDAFKALPPAKLAELSSNKELLKSVLNYHIVPVSAHVADLTKAPQKTVEGNTVAFSKAGSFVTVETAIVVQADIKASNGMVDVIDTVLMPPKK